MTNPSIDDQLRMHNPVPCYIGHSHVFCSRHYVIYEILARYLWLARRSDAAISIVDSITHVDVSHCQPYPLSFYHRGFSAQLVLLAHWHPFILGTPWTPDCSRELLSRRKFLRRQVEWIRKKSKSDYGEDKYEVPIDAAPCSSQSLC